MKAISVEEESGEDNGCSDKSNRNISLARKTVRSGHEVIKRKLL